MMLLAGLLTTDRHSTVADQGVLTARSDVKQCRLCDRCLVT